MTGTILRSAVIALVAGASVLAPLWAAHDFPPPTSRAVLSVSGEVGHANVGDDLVFDLEMLRRMPVTEFTTRTIWTDGQTVFTGVSLHDFVQAVRPEGRVLKASALNDYQVDIPLSDAVPDGPIIAYMMNGRQMSIRNKGPLWIVYPYDRNARYRSEIIYARSIWQLDRIVVGD